MDAEENFGRITRDIPVLHFMSISVFTAADYDPLLILEANFDGPPHAFWRQMDAAFGQDLREMLRCCKQLLDENGPLYAAVTTPGSAAPVASYLEARMQAPSVFHHGNRGLSRDRILREAGLFRAVQDELDAPAGADTEPSRPRCTRVCGKRCWRRIPGSGTRFRRASRRGSGSGTSRVSSGSWSSCCWPLPCPA